MGEIIAIHQKRFFTLEEAQRLLPVIHRVSRTAVDRVKLLSLQLHLIEDRARRKSIEEHIYRTFQEWHQKVRKLGCEAKGMWLVDFDSGEGYYCWRYPEASISHFHGYSEGFRGRVKLH